MAGGDPVRRRRAAPARRRCSGRPPRRLQSDVEPAIGAALAAAPAWRELPFDERAAVFLRAADLLSSTWRDRLNAATMLGQSKTVHQAEIDSACELADFLRFNVHFARQILEHQPSSSAGVWNRIGLSAAGGLRARHHAVQLHRHRRQPALRAGAARQRRRVETVADAAVGGALTMRLFEAAGLPPGVINMVTGDGAAVSAVALRAPDAGRRAFHRLDADVPASVAHGRQLDLGYATYPRLVGETGGKDFVIAHPSADPAALVTGSGARRVRVPGPEVLGGVARLHAAVAVGWRRAGWLAAVTESLTYGDVADFSNFGGAVIDRRAFDRLVGRARPAAAEPDARCSPAARRTTASDTSSVPRWPSRRTRRTSVSDASTSARCSAVHVYDDARRRRRDVDPTGIGVAVRADRCGVRA